MTPRKRTIYLALSLAVLTAITLACGTGYQTSSKILGNSGEVRVKMKDASGSNSTSVEINEDWYRESISASANLSLETGSCRATISGEDGTLLVLEAAAGSPAETSGVLVTDAFGEIDLQTDCQGGQNLDLLITFAR
jgi:C-terminal processing protease CtpA/Prc